MSQKRSDKKRKNKQLTRSSGKRSTAGIKTDRSEKIARIKLWTERIVMVSMVIILALLLFVGPFQRGLFFPRELLFANIAIFGLFIIWGVFHLMRKDYDLQEKRLIETPLDICLLILFLAYCISFFVAVQKRDALEELMKIASYLIVYVVTLDLCRHWWLSRQIANLTDDQSETAAVLPPGLSLVLHLLLLAASVVTIASLGAAAGQWDFAGAYESNRIASPMGYANTAAAYIMAAYFLSLGLAPLAARRLKVLYLTPATLMLVSVVLTFSRGAWLLLPPLALLLILAAAPGEKLRSLIYLLVTAVVAIPFALILDPVFRSETPERAWLLIALMVVAALILGLLVELYLNQSRKSRIILAGAGLVVLIAIAITTVVIPIIGPLSLEKTVEEPAQIQTIEQVVGNVKAGETYQLAMEINAKQDQLSEVGQPGYVWGVRVLEGIPGYRYVTLLDYQGATTDGWEEKLFTFRTGEEATRLEIHFYNKYPGTSISAREVKLSAAGEEQKLRFALNRILPSRFYDRMHSFSRDRNVNRRFELFRDAIKVIKDYPILGAGGGGWAALYQGYQEQPYVSKEVHNHYLQVWIEAGIFGFLSFIGIWISFAAAFIRNCIKGKSSSKQWQFWTATMLPVIALGAHSAIDWNFSMAAVGIFLFVLLGAGRSLDSSGWFEKLRIKEKRTGSINTFKGLVGILLGTFLVIYSVTLLNGLDSTWRSQELLERSNLKQSTIEMEKAIKLDPLRAENYHNLNIVIEEQVRRTGTPAEMQQVIYLSQRAYELEPFNPAYVYRYGILLFNYVDIEGGLSHLDQLTNLRPYQENSYFQPAWARLQLIEFNVEKGDMFEAQLWLDEILGFEEPMKENYGDIQSLAYVIGRANSLLGKYPAAEYYYELVQEGNQFYSETQLRLAEIRSENGVIDE